MESMFLMSAHMFWPGTCVDESETKGVENFLIEIADRCDAFLHSGF